MTTSPATIKEALLKPNLGLIDLKTDKMSSKDDPAKESELSLPPPPEEEASTAASFLIGTGASALNLLGSAVVAIGSAAVSALTAPAVEQDSKPVQPPTPAEPAERTVLGNISNALFTRATSLATSAAHTISKPTTSTVDGPSTSTVPPTEAKEAKHAAPRRASTLPVQYTATGEPFSSDPSISAMQRIPDHPCGNHLHNHQLQHCCTAPSVLLEDNRKEDQSGHFHRVEQLVKGTKRVVKDIKNVL